MKIDVRTHSPNEAPTEKTIDVPLDAAEVNVSLSVWHDSEGGINIRLSHKGGATDRERDPDRARE